MWNAAIVVATAIVALALIVWFFTGQNPAQSEGGARIEPDSISERFYRGVDRPAGPDAEAMATDEDQRRAAEHRSSGAGDSP
jgi:hypothetical protein